ncbi:amino acid adenylation domain-containing protein [Streptomyces sp. NPDC048106]|uniref:amino acid adenylation domain-containing protein n=1 Tax=Streptomyces sp. NPDC048106 TaxID=3155750 RepID=UPI0034554B0C
MFRPGAVEKRGVCRGIAPRRAGSPLSPVSPDNRAPGLYADRDRIMRVNSSVVDAIRHTVHEQGEHVTYEFLADDGTTSSKVTALELDRRARSVAAALRRRAEPGTRVMLLYPPGELFVVGFLGALYAGMVAVPVYPPDPARWDRSLPRLGAIARDARAEIVLSTGPREALEAVLADHAPDLARLPWLVTQEVMLGGADDWREPTLAHDSIGLLQYTSGSTGRPRGVVVTHGNLLSNNRTIADNFDVTGADSVVSWLPFYHDMGLLGGVLQPLLSGIPTVLMSPFAFLRRPLRWLEVIAARGATVSGGPNFSYDLCVRKSTEAERAALDLSTWRLAFCGAEPVRHRTLARFAEAFAVSGFDASALLPCYGLAEATLFVAGSGRGHGAYRLQVDRQALRGGSVEVIADGEPMVSSGRVATGHELAVVDPRTRERMPAGRVGELWVRGPSVANGYWRDEAATAETFAARLSGDTEPFLRTGDVGFVHDGQLFVTGRVKELMIVRGRNHYPHDIEETAVRASDRVRPGCGAAFSVETRDGEQCVLVQEVAADTPEDELPSVAEAITAAVRQEHGISLADVVLLAPRQVPKTSSGKVQRLDCRAAYVDGVVAGERYRRSTAASHEVPVAPRFTASRADLLALPDDRRTEAIERLLRRAAGHDMAPGAAVAAELGLDSLGAAELAFDIEEHLGVVMDLALLLGPASVRQVAVEVDARLRDAPPEPASPEPEPPDPAEPEKAEPEKAEHTADVAPLSAGQQSLLFMREMEGQDYPQNVSVAVRLTDPVNVTVLADAVRLLGLRHPVLASRFGTDGSRRWQRSCPDRPFELDIVDLAGEPESSLRTRVDGCALTPFDIERGDVARARLFVGIGSPVLVLAQHHVITDFWSVVTLFEELTTLYGQLLRGREPQLPPAVAYAEFVRWQGEYERSARCGLDERYWLDLLAGDVRAPSLPYHDQARRDRALPGGAVDNRRITVPPGLVAELRRVADDCGTTLFAVLMAAFERLIGAHSGEDEFLLGTTTTGRPEARFRNTLGYFSNIVPVRVDLGTPATVAELVSRTGHQVRESLGHQHFPYRRLVELLRTRGDSASVINAALVFERPHGAVARGVGPVVLGAASPQEQVSAVMGDLTLEPFPIGELPATQFDITLHAVPVDDSLAAHILVRADRFAPDFADQLAGQYLDLLQQIPRRPAAPVSALRLAGEAASLLRADVPARTRPQVVCAHEMFEAQADSAPDAVAIVSGEREFTYAEVERTANRIAHELRRYGLGPDDSVGLCLPRSADLVIAMLAVLKAGAAFVPLDPALPPSRLADMVGAARCARILCQDATAALAAELGVATHRVDTAAPGDEGRPGRVATGAGLAYTIFTSGSTGRPKGAQIEHRSLVSFLLSFLDIVGIEPGDRVLQFAPLTFDACIEEIFATWSVGATLVLRDEAVLESPARFWAWCDEQRLTLVDLPTAFFHVLVTALGSGVEVPSALRTVLIAGEAVHPDKLARWFAADRLRTRLYNRWGTTEATVCSTFALLGPESGRAALPREVSIGTDMADAVVHVLDAALQPVPDGVVGEAYIGGAGVGRGYASAPRRTAERYLPDPFTTRPGRRLYATGDLVRRAGDGELRYVGRADQQVKVRGYRIELGEIDAVLRRHPDTVEAAVVASGGPGETELIAAVTGDIDPGKLRDWLHRELPGYMVPSRLLVLDRIPLNRHGKVDAAALRAHAVAAARSGESAVMSPVERRLAGLWCAVLDVAGVGLDDEFFSLGGHSLRVANLNTAVRGEFGVQPPLRMFFEATTVRAQAARVAELLATGGGSPAVAGLPEPAQALPPAEPTVSLGQKRLWFLDRLAGGSGAYTVAGALRIYGALDRDALKHALDALVARHAALRTGFQDHGGRPVPYTGVDFECPFEVLDRRATPPARRESVLADIAAEHAGRPFSLDKPPLVRAALVEFGPAESTLLLCFHHIICDGRSMEIIAADLAEQYDRRTRRRDAQAPAPALDYARWAGDESTRLASAAGQEGLAFWTRRLGDAPRAIDLPADRPRPALQTFNGGRVPLVLGAEDTALLRALAGRTRATVFMVLSACLASALSRLSGQRSVVIGTPDANRPADGAYDDVVGFFVNTVPLHFTVDGADTAARLLDRVRTTTLEAMAWKWVPFSAIVEAVVQERDPSRSPVFQVILDLHSGRLPVPDMAGLRVETEPLFTGVAKTDLTFEITDDGGPLTGWLEYNSDLFEPETARYIARLFAETARAMARRPDERITTPAVTAALDRWPSEVRPGDVPDTFWERFETVVDTTPDAVAIEDGDRALTYRELRGQVDQVARVVRSEFAVRPGDIVAVEVASSVEAVISVLAVQRCGAAYVPIDPDYPAERRHFMLEDSGARTVVTRQLVERALNRPPLADPLPSVHPDAAAYLIYTSGSTGRPKGALVSHRNLAHHALVQAPCYGIDAGTRMLQFASLSFDGSAWEIFSVLGAGGTLCVAERRHALVGEALADTLTARGITACMLPPSVIASLPDRPLPALRTLVSAGEPCRAELVARWQPGRRFLNGYGPTECTVMVTAAECAPGRPVSLGSVLPGSTVHVLDEDLEPTPTGAVGELYVGGAGVGTGYHNRPAMTAERYLPDPFSDVPGARMYRTGDLVRVRADGTVEYRGRRDNQLKVRSYRVEPAEIEAVLLAADELSDTVSDVAVRRLDSVLVAHVQSRDTTLSPQALERICARTLPAYMVPAAFVVRSELPRLPNGKLDGSRLERPQRSDYVHDKPLPLESEAERAIGRVWAEVLDVDEVGGSDSFFALGGHSLLATVATARVAEEIGREVPLRVLFEAPVLRDYAALCAETAAGGTSDLIGSHADDGGAAPLSVMQERVWILEELDRGTGRQALHGRYHLSGAMRLTGALDEDALRRAVARLLARHTTLRTVVAEEDGALTQHVLDHVEVVPVRMPLTGATVAQRLAEAHDVVAREAMTPMDLAAGPLLRLRLLEVGPEDTVLVVTLHHIVGDGWSVEILKRDLAHLYAHEVGHPPTDPLPPLPATYQQYARWQRHRLGTGVLDESIAYWRSQLTGLPDLVLPVARQGTELPSAQGNHRRATIEGPLRSGIARLAAAHGATEFMVLAAALQITLGRLAGQRDFAIGVPVAGRGRRETADLIGFFVNSLVLRADLSGDPTFAELLDRVRATTVDAYEHQDVPFETLVGELAPERDLTTTPLFQVYLNLLNIPAHQAELPGLTVEPFDVPDLDAKFPLAFYVDPGTARISLDLMYAVDRFEAAMMDELLAQWISVLDQAVADSALPIGALRLDTPLTRRRLPDPTAPLDAAWHGSVVERFEERAGREPRRTAINEPGQRVAYGELASATAELASLLRHHQVGKGDVVAVYGDRCASLVWAVLAVLRTGAAFTLLDPNHPTARLVDCLAVARPSALLHLAAAGPVPAEVSGALDGMGTHCRVELPARLGEARHLLPPGAARTAAVPVAPDDCAYLAFTSGSTGRPKGIRGAHRSLTHFVPWLADTFELRDTDRYSMLSGVGHDPLHREMFTPLTTGGAVCVPAPEDIGTPGRLARWFRAERISVSHLTPPMARLLDELNTDDVTLPDLRRVFFTGDTLTRRDVRAVTRLGDAALCVNLYGATESQRAVGYFVVPAADTTAADDLVGAYPLGRGMPDVQLLVLNEAGHRAGVGEPGEIVIRSPHIALGYADDAALTSAKFVRNPFTGDADDRMYRTGDLGKYTLDGAVVSLGRTDDQVKIRGYRVETDEVRHVVSAAPGVRDALVVARPDASGETALVAYAVAAGEPRPDEGGIRAFVRARLPEYMVPARVVTLDAFPLTPNHKIDRAALPEPAGVVAVGDDGADTPLTPAEELVAGIWREVLGVARVLPDDNFFALGGHSLMATRVVSRIRRVFGRDIALRTLFEEQTLRQMAARLEATAGDGPGTASIPALPRGGALPASFGQERLWILDRLEGDTHAYNTSTAVRLRGPLDTTALTGALADLVERHETLRTRLVLSDGTVHQVVEAAGDVTMPLDVVDLSAEPARTAEESWRRCLDDAAAARFDLAEAPLERATLIRLAQDDHILVLAAHHVVADAWGIQVLVRDFATLYQARRHATAPDLPPLTVRYADWSSWQRACFERGDHDTQLDFWRAALADPAPLLEFPAQRPRPVTMSNRGLTVHRMIPAELVDRVRHVGQENSATLFMTLLAAFVCQLHGYSGASDIAVGVPVSTRSVVETEDVVGFFVNTIVCRNRLSPDDSYLELLDGVRATTLAAFAHQDVPFDRVIEALQPSRDLSRNPLFQVMFVLHNAPAAEVELGDLRMERLYASTHTAKFDLSLDLAEEPDGLHATLELNADLFDAETGTQLLDHFETLLNAIADAPRTRLADLEPRPAAEVSAQEALSTGPEPGTPLPPAMALERWARHTPDAPAVVDGTTVWSYRAFRELVAGLAGQLAPVATGAEPAVVVCARRSAAHIAVALACGAIGATYVPVGPAFPDRRISAVLDRLGDAVVVTDAEQAERLRTLAGPDRPHLVLGTAAPAARGFEPRQVPPRQRAYVIFTSGSTGEPKGAAIEQAGLLNHLDLMAHDLGLTSSDVIAQTAPQSFDISVWQMLVAVLRGATTVISDDETSRDADALLALVRGRGITVLQLVPGMIRGLLERAAPQDLRTVRYLLATGEELPADLCAEWLRRFPGIPVINAYGPAECSDDTHLMVLSTPPPPGRPVSIGSPVAGVSSRVVDEDGRVRPFGVPGELVIGGVAVGRGYVGDPRTTAERFLPDPFATKPGARLYRTGDRARLMPDGRLEFLGRLDHQLKIRGYRIEPGEVEAALRALDGVHDAAVTAGAAGDAASLIAWVVGGGHDPAALDSALASRLPRYMVPDGYVFVDRLPRNPNGKLDRTALTRDDAPIERVRQGYAELTGPTERLVASVFETVLGCSSVGALDDFFRLGGHSLLATRLIGELAGRTDIELPLRMVFEHSTVRGMAQAIDELQWAALSDAERQELQALLGGLTDDEARAILASEDEGDA